LALHRGPAREDSLSRVLAGPRVTIGLLRQQPMELVMVEFERTNAIAFNIRNFQFAMDFEGRLVLRLWYEDEGQEKSPTFCFEPEQDVRFGHGLFLAMDAIGKHRSSSGTQQ
jgi:hypothetical protein